MVLLWKSVFEVGAGHWDNPVGVTDESQVVVGLHERASLSPFLFVVVMDRLTDEVRQEGCLQTT